jgi:hypothetical protein
MDDYYYTGVVYLYTFANGKVYIGRTSRDPQECHIDHINAMKTYSYNEFADAMREQGEPQYKILETVKGKSQEELIKALNEREDYWKDFYQSTNPEKGYNRESANIDPEAKAKKMAEMVEHYANLFVNGKYRLFQAVSNKLECVETINDEERKFYDKYFGPDNMFYGADIRKEACGGFWREKYEDYAMFTLEQEMLERAEEYVHEEEAAFVKIFFHS